MIHIEDLDDFTEVTAHGGSVTYRLVYDDIWDEWSVASDDDNRAQGQWFPTKTDAINFVLYLCDCVDERNYERSHMVIT